ncbi:MAG TPA: hypothetical protein VFD73_18045 [Gemmatimonadales bacterium]|jgi:hypothetical protein|nr:hypothetical protein [Gemmatimonadales bacterium]
MSPPVCRRFSVKRKIENSLSNPADHLAHLGAMDSAELLERAHRYRIVAAGLTDEQTKAGLLDLADKYEALARELEQARPESNKT